MFFFYEMQELKHPLSLETNPEVEELMTEMSGVPLQRDLVIRTRKLAL